MPTKNSDINFSSAISTLMEIPLHFKEQGQSAALKELADLTRLTTNIHTCTLTFVNLYEPSI